MNKEFSSNKEHKVTLFDKKKVFIQRDYTKGLTIRFSTDFPEQLVRKIDENAWKDMIRELNARYASAEGVSSGTVCETLLGCFTCYLIRCCVRPSYMRKIDDIGEFIDELNSDVLVPKGIHMANPISRGFRVLEVTLIYEKADPVPAQYQTPSSSLLLPRL